MWHIFGSNVFLFLNKHWSGSTKIASPGEKLSAQLTDEECGRQCASIEHLQTSNSAVSCNQPESRPGDCNDYQLPARIPLPTPSGPPSPRGREFSRRRDGGEKMMKNQLTIQKFMLKYSRYCNAIRKRSSRRHQERRGDSGSPRVGYAAGHFRAA